jgi:hypothetical protein
MFGDNQLITIIQSGRIGDFKVETENVMLLQVLNFMNLRWLKIMTR